MSVVPVSYEELVFLNEFVVSQTSQTGGEDGVLNESNIRNCCDLPTNNIFGQEQFEGIMKKAAALLECISRSHGFINANKRTIYYPKQFFHK